MKARLEDSGQPHHKAKEDESDLNEIETSPIKLNGQQYNQAPSSLNKKSVPKLGEKMQESISKAINSKSQVMREENVYTEGGDDEYSQRNEGEVGDEDDKINLDEEGNQNWIGTSLLMPQSHEEGMEEQTFQKINDTELKRKISSRFFLTEIKQFCQLHAIVAEKLKKNPINELFVEARTASNSKTNRTTKVSVGSIHEFTKESTENSKLEKGTETKKKGQKDEASDNVSEAFNQIYLKLIDNPEQSIVPFLDLMLDEVVGNDLVPINLLRVGIKSLQRIFENIDPNIHLTQNNAKDKTQFIDKDFESISVTSKRIKGRKSGRSIKYYNPQHLIAALISCQLDDHNNDIDQQELILASIQKLILTILNTLPIQACPLQVFDNVQEFLMKMLSQRGFSHDPDMGQTAHFSEKVKKNTMKWIEFSVIKRKEDLSFICQFICECIDKLNKAPEVDAQGQQVFTPPQRAKQNEKNIKSIAFGIRTTLEIIQKLSQSMILLKFKSFIANNISHLVTIACRCSEQTDEVIKSQAQLFFIQLSQIILDLNIPVREEYEILYVKCALKPVIERMNILCKQIKEEKLKASVGGGSPKKSKLDDMKLELSDEGEDLISSKLDDEIIDFDQPIFTNDLLLQLAVQTLTETVLSLTPEQFGLLFLIYDCQHFSESIISKSLSLVLKFSINNQQKVNKIFYQLFQNLNILERSKALPQRNYNTIGTLNSLGTLQGRGNNKFESSFSQVQVTHQRLKYMLDLKQQQKALARLINEKPKLFLNKCEEIYKYIDQQAPWDIASKILLYSREPQVELVTEIIGGKEQRNQEIFVQFMDKQDFNDLDLEQSLRRFMQTFRLAGVESQVVLRVMAEFAYKFFDKSSQGVNAPLNFSDREECYEMAYLLIVLQTTMHNPNIKQKLRIKDFELQAKTSCPKSYDNLPMNFIASLYEKIKAKELSSPLSRDWYNSPYTEADLTFCRIKLSQQHNPQPYIERPNPKHSDHQQDNMKLTQTEFVATADLTQKHLFNFNNEIDAIKDSDKNSLISGALRHLVSSLTNRFLKRPIGFVNLDDYKVLQQVLQVNKKLHNYEFTDKILRSLHKIDQSNEFLINEILSNYSQGARNTVTLIPQIIFSKGVRISKNSDFFINRFGLVDQKNLLEICQASERLFRRQLQEKQNLITRQILLIEGKSVQEIEEFMKKQTGIFTTNDRFQSARLKKDTQNNQDSKQNDNHSAYDAQQTQTNSIAQPQQAPSSYSIVNIFRNYFNDASGTDQSSANQNPANVDKINRLRKAGERLKIRQTEQMRFMNQLYATLIQKNTTPKQEGQNAPSLSGRNIRASYYQGAYGVQNMNSNIDSYHQAENEDLYDLRFDFKIQEQMASLHPKIFQVVKDNLFQIIKGPDGLHSLLFIKNALNLMIETLTNERNQNQIPSQLTGQSRKKEIQRQMEEAQKILDLIWQEMHLIMSKLTMTKRKIAYFNKQGDDDSIVQCDFEQDDDSQSQLDLSRIESHFSSGAGSSSADSFVLTAELSKSENQKKEGLFDGQGGEASGDLALPKTSSERRVYEALCKHLILEIFFDINHFQLTQISSLNIINPSLRLQPNKLSLYQDQQSQKKQIQECMREIWRIFKSIVQGPQSLLEQQPGSQENAENSDEDIKQASSILNETGPKLSKIRKVFDDLHVIIVLEKLLQLEIPKEQGRNLPLNSYDKVYKLLRNLIIHSTATIEEIQMEVYVQNNDSFQFVIQTLLKYVTFNVIQGNGFVPYDLISLILDMIDKITRKSKCVMLDIDVSQYISLFNSIFDIMAKDLPQYATMPILPNLDTLNKKGGSQYQQYDIWMRCIDQYRETVLYNKILIESENWEQTSKHALLTYKDALLRFRYGLFLNLEFGSDNQQKNPFYYTANLTKVEDTFSVLYLEPFSFNGLLEALNIKQPLDRLSESKIQKIASIAELLLENSSEVFIKIVDCASESLQIYLKPNCLNQEEKNKREEDFFEIFKTLWFSYLKYQLDYVKNLRPLDACVHDNLTRVTSFLRVQPKLLGYDKQEEGEIKNADKIEEVKEVWAKSLQVISVFFPDFKTQFE